LANGSNDRTERKRRNNGRIGEKGKERTKERGRRAKEEEVTGE